MADLRPDRPLIRSCPFLGSGRTLPVLSRRQSCVGRHLLHVRLAGRTRCFNDYPLGARSRFRSRWVGERPSLRVVLFIVVFHCSRCPRLCSQGPCSLVRYPSWTQATASVAAAGRIAPPPLLPHVRFVPPGALCVVDLSPGNAARFAGDGRQGSYSLGVPRLPCPATAPMAVSNT
jgi:hypothetical protein